MFAEAFGIVLLILLIVITWRVVDSIMQAPGTSAALPVVSAPPSKVVAGTPSQTNFTMPDMSSYYGSYFPTGSTSSTPTIAPAGTPVTTATVPGATATPSALPPVVITPPSPADLQASMGLSGLSMPTVDMSKYYPTSLAGTPAPAVPAPAPASTPVVAPPVVSAPAPVVAPPVVAAVTPVPTPLVSQPLTAFSGMPSGAIVTGKFKRPADPPTCPIGYSLDWHNNGCFATTRDRSPYLVPGICPSGSQRLDTVSVMRNPDVNQTVCVICPPGSTGVAQGGNCISGV